MKFTLRLPGGTRLKVTGVRDSDVETLAMINQMVEDGEGTNYDGCSGCPFDPDVGNALDAIYWILDENTSLDDLLAMSAEEVNDICYLMDPCYWDEIFPESVLTDEFVSDFMVPAAWKLIDAFDDIEDMDDETQSAWGELFDIFEGWPSMAEFYPTIEDPFDDGEDDDLDEEADVVIEDGEDDGSEIPDEAQEEAGGAGEENPGSDGDAQAEENEDGSSEEAQDVENAEVGEENVAGAEDAE